MESMEPTYWVKIYASGPIEVAKQVIRQECLKEGLCVTISPTLFIYAGGEESGFVIGLLQYPRFPTAPEKIYQRAVELAKIILPATCQLSTLIVDPSSTLWITNRENH